MDVLNGRGSILQGIQQKQPPWKVEIPRSCTQQEQALLNNLLGIPVQHEGPA